MAVDYGATFKSAVEGVNELVGTMDSGTTNVSGTEDSTTNTTTKKTDKSDSSTSSSALQQLSDFLKNWSNSSNNSSGRTSQNTQVTANSVTKSTADPMDLAASRSQRDFASNSANNAYLDTEGLTASILRKGAQDFLPTGVQANQAGVYDSSTLSLLRNDALSRATNDAVANVLNYKTQEQQIAATTGGDLLTATKSTTTDNTTTTAGTTDTSQQGSTNTSGGQEGGSTTNNNNYSNTNSMDTINQLVDSIFHGTSTKSGTTTQSKGGTFSDSVVCTELYRQGRMDRKHYMSGLPRFSRYPLSFKQAYWIWAVPAAAHLRAHPYSKLSSFLEKAFISRCYGQWTGTLTVNLITAFCYLTILPFRSVKKWLMLAPQLLR